MPTSLLQESQKVHHGIFSGGLSERNSTICITLHGWHVQILAFFLCDQIITGLKNHEDTNPAQNWPNNAMWLTIAPSTTLPIAPVLIKRFEAELEEWRQRGNKQTMKKRNMQKPPQGGQAPRPAMLDCLIWRSRLVSVPCWTGGHQRRSSGAKHTPASVGTQTPEPPKD